MDNYYCNKCDKEVELNNGVCPLCNTNYKEIEENANKDNIEELGNGAFGSLFIGILLDGIFLITLLYLDRPTSSLNEFLGDAAILGFMFPFFIIGLILIVFSLFRIMFDFFISMTKGDNNGRK